MSRQKSFHVSDWDVQCMEFQQLKAFALVCRSDTFVSSQMGHNETICQDCTNACLVEAEFFHLAVEGFSADAQGLGSLGPVSVNVFQDPEYVALFHFR